MCIRDRLNNITTTVQRLPDTTFIYSPGQITGITTVPHGFLTGTDVNIRNVSGTEHDVIQGMHRITVPRVFSGIASAIETLGGGGNSGLTTSIRLVDDVNKFKVNDIIRIDHEELKIFGIDTLQNEIDCLRIQNGTAGTGHTVFSRVEKLVNEFTFPLSGCPETPVDYTVYFDAANVVGAGLSAGTGIGHTITSQDFGTRKIPTQRIFLPRHSIQDGEKLSY